MISITNNYQLVGDQLCSVIEKCSKKLTADQRLALISGMSVWLDKIKEESIAYQQEKDVKICGQLHQNNHSNPNRSTRHAAVGAEWCKKTIENQYKEGQ